MCGALKTSVEHVPPKGLFPKSKDLPQGVNLRKQLITVPACDAHNIEKTCDDEYLMYVLVLGIQNNATAQGQINTKIIRALEKNPSVAKLISQKQQSVYVEDTALGTVKNTQAFQIDSDRVNNAFDHIGRALYFHHLKFKWTESIQVIPLFLPALDGESLQELNKYLDLLRIYIEQIMANQPSHGENPEVFKYQILEMDQSSLVIMLLTFYEGSKVILHFKNHN